MRNVLTCFILFAILMSVLPVSIFAMNSSNNATEASNHSKDLEKSFLLPLDSNDTGETVSALSCDVYIKIDDDTCVGYDVYVDGVYQFTEGQDGTPDGYCAFYVSAGTHKFELRKNGCTTSKSWYCQCGTVYRWVSMPDNWCEGGNHVEVRENEIKFTGTAIKYYESHSQFHYWVVRVDKIISGPQPYKDQLDVCIWDYEIPDPWGSVDQNLKEGDQVEVYGTYYVYDGICSASLYGLTDYYIKKIGAIVCEVYIKIEDDTCVGYEVYVDGVYKFTEGQDGTPDGYCAFYVSAGTHEFELRKNGCSISKSWYCQCGTDYSWVSMNNMDPHWCDSHQQKKEVTFSGMVTGLGPYVMGSKEWYVSVDEWISGSLPCDEIDVAIGIYPPMGSCDENINKGDNVEVYGEVDPWGGSECTVGLNGESYYIKKIESCGKILEYAISDGTYPLPMTVMAHMKYKSYMKSPTKFKGVFLVKNQRTGKIYPCSKEQITNIYDSFGYGKGNSLQIRFEDEVEDIGVYDAKLELRNFYTDELCDETEWLKDQFKIEASGAAGIDYKFDEYGVIQQAYDADYALNMDFPPMGQIRKPYINLIPYSDTAKGSTVESIFIKVNNGEITQYSPQENAILSADKGTITWQGVPISDDYHAELFYEAEFVHPQEIAIEIIPSDTEIKAEVKNIADYPAYNLIVLYPEKPGAQEESLWTDWHYGMVDLLAEGEKKTLVLSDGLPPETVKATLYDYLTHGLDDAGLDSTQHRNDWINEWIDEWLGRNNNPFVARSSVIYRIPQELYEQYFASYFPPSLQCWPKQGMVRVGLVELYDLPAGTQPKTIYVDDDFVDDPPNHKWDTIQEGVDDAEDGDTVLVYSGTYNENVGVDKSIVLKGIDYPVVVSGGFISHVGDNALEGVTVDGFNLTDGIWCFAVNNSMFINNTISNTQYGGMLFEWSYNNIIKENEILGNYYGIQLFAECCNNTIVGNNIINNHIGINLLEFASNNAIYHNNFNNNDIQANDGVDPALYGTNSWDNGYPSGGNYWSNYDEETEGAMDVKNGQKQDQPGSDGIVDTAYKVPGGVGAKDNYPLMGPWGEPKPDLTLSPEDISFSNLYPAEGENITINATIRNIGDAYAKDVVVQFFDNDMQIRSDQTISTVNASGTGTAQVNWTAISGSRNISVIVDPESVIAEGNETNNIAFKTINISVPRKLNVNIIEPINYSVYSVGDPVQFNITVSDLNDSLLSSGISAYAVLAGPDNASKIIPFSIDGNFFVGEYSVSSDDSKGVWVANVTAYNSTHSGLSTSIIIFTSPYTIHVKSDKASYVLGEVVAFDAEAYRLGVSEGVLTGSDVCLNISIYDKDFTRVYGPESMSYDNFSQSFISQVDTNLLGKGWFNVSVAGDDASGNLANTTTEFFVADDFEVNVSTDKSIYDRGESVNISGAAVFGDGSAVDNATVSIATNVKGFTRTFVTDTNDDGEFNYTFNPFTYEAGNYNLTVTVDYWDLERAEEADFSITGLYLRPESETLDMAEYSEYVFNLTLFNLGESTLTGITASLVDRNATDNVFGVLDTSTLPDMLLPGENRSFALVVEASEDALGESEFSVVVSSVQTSDGVSEILVRIHPNKPVLDVIPGKVEAGLNLNHSTVKSFTISNSGYGTLRNVTLNQPSNPWLQIISDERVGDIPPGVNVTINFVISSFHVGLGEYSEAVNISSDNYETVSVEVTVHVTDSSTGSLLFYVGDVLERNVSNASVYLINYDTYDEFISLTNTTGYVLLENLPIGRYTYKVSSKDTGHFPQTGTVIVEPMKNPKLVEVMLYLSFVDFEWEVIPTAIKDRYIIRLNLTFETDIPIPILVAYPPFLNYNLAPGEIVQDSITLYNIGLISLYDVTISPPNFGDGVEIDFLLGQKVPEIKAKERVEVPFTIRLSDTASECKRYKGKISATGTFIHFINSKQVEGTAGTSIPLTIRTPCAQHDVPLPDIPSPCFFIGLPFLGEFHTGPCIDVDGISSYNNYRSDSAVIWILSVTDCEGETLEIFTKELIATNCNHKGINLFPKAWGVSKDCSISPISFSFLDASLIEGVDEFWYGTWTCPSTSDWLWCNILPNEVAKLDVHRIGISKGVGFSPINFVGGMLFFFYGYDTPICPGLVPIIGMSFNEMCIPQVGPIKPIDYRIDWPFWGPYPDWRGDIPFPWRDFSIDIRINPLGLPGVPTPPPPPKMPKPPLISDTIHEIVKLYISQEATMERDAFYAGLSMYNKMGDKDISSMKINLKITDSNNSANDLFFIRSPRLVGIGDVSGSGTLGPLSRANIQWLIIPKPGAGGTYPEGTVYNISAEISYSVEWQNFKFRTQQAQITVKPQPQIVLDYYIPSDVVANIPFKLAVKATNEGYSTARNFEIETAQPVIYDNVAGLMIDFKIIGSSLSGQPRSNSLKVNFGNIEPRESKLTWWEIVTTLDGTFTEFTGTYTHSSELGGAETSFIKELNTHIILREIDTGEITYDFLVDSDMDGIPDFVIDSVHGTSTEVVSVDYTVTMAPTPENPTLMISTKKVEGKWICTSVEDPYENKVPIKRVERADGKILSPQNYWMRDDRILIVDDPVQEYKITYSGITLPMITNIKPGNITAISGDTIEFNCSVTDDIGVVSVWLNYTINNWTTYNIQIMDNPYTDFYTTNLTLPDVKVIEYKIEANDEVGNLGSSGIFKMMILGYIYVPNGYPTIQTAIDAASAGNTIIVRDGTYTENIDVTKPHLTIKSENGADCTIVQAANPKDHVFEITADNVNISGFTLKNAIGSWKAGIYLASEHCNISNNNASNNYNGIYLSSSNNNQLTDNIANANHNYGISLSSTANNNISCNWVVQNQQGGFHIADGSTGNVIKENNIMANGESIGDSWHYNLYNDQSDIVIAENNYWGTDSLTMIAASIYDGSDDPSKGMVYSEPFLTEPTPCAPGPEPALPVISNPTVIPNIGNNGDTFTWSATVTYPDCSEPTANLSLQGLGDLNHNGYCDLNDVVAIITIWSNGSYETLTLVEQRIVDIDCDGDLDDHDCSLAEEMWENDGWLTLQMDKSGSTYTHSRILFDTNNNSVDYDYRWKIAAKDSYSEISTEVFDGPIVRSPSQLNSPPNTPNSPSPSDGATDVSIAADLSWTGGDPDPGDTVSYDVYFGTSTSPPLVSNDLSGTTYDPGTLSYNTKYYWRIIATDNNGATSSGDLWDFFTTGYALFIFQSTNNAVPITVDGTLQSSPYTATWISGSVHSVNALSEFIAQQDCLKYVFTGWTGAVTQAVTVLPPTISPGTYTANYKKQYYLTVDTEPQGIATISGEGWYDEGPMATTGSAPEEVTAGGEKYQFETWKVDGSPVSMPFNWIQLKMDNCHTVTASYQRSSPFIFQSTDNAVPITIDGTSQSSPYTASWTSGSFHSVNALSEFIAQPDCLKYVFTGWTGAITVAVTVLPPILSPGTYTANYKKQYYLTVNTEPQSIATISGEGWYDQNAMATTGSAPEEVTAGGKKYQFETWKVDGSPVSLPFDWVPLKMDNCHTVTASYQEPGGAQVLWLKTYDFDECYDRAYAVATDSKDNIIVTGKSDGEWLTIKYDPNDNELWTKRYENGRKASGVAVDSNDNIIVVGDTDIGGTWDYLITKYDPSGNRMWYRRLASGYHEYPEGVAVDSNDNIIVTGRSHRSTEDCLTVKFNSNGDVLWTKYYDGGQSDEAHAVAVDSNDNIIVTGESRKGGFYGDQDYLTIKYDSNGDVLCTKKYDSGDENDDNAYGIAVDSTDNFIVTGYGYNGDKIVTIKYNRNGEVLWEKTFEDGAYARGVAVDSYDNIVVAGESKGANDDFLTIKYDSNGNVLWNMKYDDGNDDHARGVAVDSENNIIVTGDTWNGKAYAEDYLTIKYGEHHIQNSPPNKPSGPSPFNGAIAVSIDADLSWTGGDPDVGDTVTYDVYFGTPASPPLVSNDQSGTTYDPGTLSKNTKYYWKIIATDNHGASTTGDLWDFNTGSGEEFPKRKLITIDNTRNANTLTDYQVKLDVIYDPEMQPDFDDLRFTDSSDNRLNYWFEDYAPSAHATVWVKIPLIPGSGKTTVYMYYGNPSASSQSNGDATFEFFDDFEDESIDTGKWTTTTTGFGAFVTENSGEINIHTDAISNTTADLISQNSYGPDVAIMFRASISAGQWSDHKGLGFLSTNVGNDWDQTGDSVHWRGQDDDLYASNKYSGSCTNAFIEDGYFSGYRTWEIAWLSSEIRYYADGIFKATHTTNVPSVSITPRFSLKTYTTAPANPLDVFVDYVYVRKYAEPEPTITVEGTSLVAEWHFDEGSGSTVKDSSGNGNDGIIHGATWVDGIKGKALKFDGKDDHVEVQDSSSLRITGNLNVEAWVKVEELGSKYHFIVSKHYTPAGYTLYINPANKFAFEISSQHSVASTTKPELGKWYHVVGTYDQSQLKIYVNDVLENTKSCTAKLATNNQKLRIGQWSAGGYCFKGIIDEVSIYANA